MSKFSHSKIGTYDKCQKKYRLKYVDREKEAFDGIEGFVGKVVHRAMERMSIARTERGAMPLVRDCHAWFDAEWTKDYDPKRIRVIKAKDTVALQQERGHRMVSNGYDIMCRDMRVDLSTERKIQFSLDGHEIIGYVDRVAQARNGNIFVIDYKTGSRTPSSIDGTEAMQLGVYGTPLIDEYEIAEGDVIHLELWYLASCTILRKCMGRKDIPTVHQYLRAAIQDIEGEEDYDASPSALCRWCGYNDRCEEAQK